MAEDAIVVLDGREVDRLTGGIEELPVRSGGGRLAIFVTSPDERRRATYVVDVQRLAPWQQ
jgi:hypothetical protein